MRKLQLILLLALLVPGPSLAQVVQRCQGETFEALAAQRLQDARLGPLVARFNGLEDKACTKGRFVRFPASIRHEVRLGQTVAAIASRFTRAPGGAAFIRRVNGLPPGTEPNPGTILEVPAELSLKLGTRPDQELQAIFGLPPLPEIKAYNEVAQLKKGGTVYIPLMFELAPVQGTSPPPPAPPPPARRMEPDPDPDSDTEPARVVDPQTVPEADARPARTSTVQVDLPRVLQVAAVGRFDGFRHPIHQAVMQDGWQCALCHEADPRRAHEYKPVGEALCLQCHIGAERTPSVLRAYRLELTYSHDQHLSPTREARAKGYELACNDCHPALEGKGRRGQPQHAACAKCHNPSEVPPVVGKDCSGCHALAETLDRRMMAQALLAEHYRRSERETDVVFGHDEHVALYDAGSEAACDRCHVDARRAETMAEIEPLRMADCLDCHRGLKRELAGMAVSLDRCRTCHISTRAEVVPVFAALLEKPVTHSRTFRRRHADVAAADDGVCAACHTELADGAGSNCNACHQQLRPQDHTVRWVQTPHGRAAVRDPDRCATCHLKDRCADCHAQPPRDHFPQAAFQLRHGRSARVSTRRCLTCHIPQVDCARCHDVGRL